MLLHLLLSARTAYVFCACGFDRNEKWEWFCKSKLRCKSDTAKMDLAKMASQCCMETAVVLCNKSFNYVGSCVGTYQRNSRADLWSDQVYWSWHNWTKMSHIYRRMPVSEDRVKLKKCHFAIGTPGKNLISDEFSYFSIFQFLRRFFGFLFFYVHNVWLRWLRYIILNMSAITVCDCFMLNICAFKIIMLFQIW